MSTVVVEKWGEPSTRIEVSTRLQCPACEFARSALREEGDVIFVLVHHEDWGLRRVELVAAARGLGFLCECHEVTAGQAREELARAASRK